MSIPDIQRILLLIGIGICAYLLVQAWVSDAEKRAQDSESGAIPAVPLTSDQASGNVDPDAPLPEEAVQTDVASSEGSDVPDASFLQSGSGVQVDETAQTVSRELVKVSSPLYDIWIDPVGGDIVGAKLTQYPVSLREPDNPMPMLDRRVGRTYIAQSGLIGADGFDQPNERPVYSVSRTEWSFDQDTLEVPLTFERDGVFVTKRFIFDAERYDFDVQFNVRNNTDREFSSSFFAQIKRDGGSPDGIRGGFIRPPAYVGAALTTNDKRYKKLRFKEIDKKEFRESVSGGWIAVLQHYFMSAWIPEQQNEHLYYATKDRLGNYRFGFTAPTQIVSPGGIGNFGAKFYVGPKEQKKLQTLAPHLALTVDYGFFWWLSVPMYQALSWIQSFVQNWGLSIILLTILIKTVLFPLSQMSYKSMAKMRKLSPQIKRLQERFGTDKQRMGQELMSLYQKEKTNPLAGCLPMLLQMPVFFALYWVLIESVELRQAPFIFWIRDLSAMDPLFVLPILNAGAMFLMQRLNPPMPDPMQQRVMMMMPIMFGLICVFMPAGLVLYWVVNSLYSMAHHYWALRQAGAH